MSTQPRSVWIIIIIVVVILAILLAMTNATGGIFGSHIFGGADSAYELLPAGDDSHVHTADLGEHGYGVSSADHDHRHAITDFTDIGVVSKASHTHDITPFIVDKV